LRNSLDCSRQVARFASGIIVWSKWRFGDVNPLKGNCLFGDEKWGSGKSNRTYAARFTRICETFNGKKEMLHILLFLCLLY